MDCADQSFNISFDTDISIDPDRTSDGIVTDDQTLYLDRSCTRAHVILEQLKNDEIKEWAKRTEDQRDQFLLETMDPIFEIAARRSGSTHIARALFQSSELKTKVDNFITECERQVSAIEEILQKGHAKKLKMVPFSKVKEGHINLLGVATHDISQKFQTEVVQLFTEMLPDNRSNPLTTYLSGNTAHTFFRWLDITTAFMPHTIEASSRKIIDVTFLGLADAMMTGMQGEQIQAPELKVRLPSKKEPRHTVFIKIPEYNRVDTASADAMIFTGAIDYAIITLSTPKATEKDQPPERRPFVSDGAKALRKQLTEKSYDIEGVMKGLGDRGHDFHILFVEAKRAASNSSTTESDAEAPDSQSPQESPMSTADAFKLLSTHEPQVVAETMVGIKYLEIRRNSELAGRLAPNHSRLLYLPWCLTDGVHWIFGAVLYRSDADKWFNFRLGEAANDRKPGSTHGPTPHLSRLMTMLFLLCSNHFHKFLERVNRDYLMQFLKQSQQA